MLSISDLLVFLLICHPALTVTTAAVSETPKIPTPEEPREVRYHEDCRDNTTACNPAELLQCLNGLCECENGTTWETAYNTCRPLSHQPMHPMSWAKLALIVGFSLAVLLLVIVFVVRKRMKETSFKPTLEERRKSVFAEARGDIPMKQRKFSQHFA